MSETRHSADYVIPLPKESKLVWLSALAMPLGALAFWFAHLAGIVHDREAAITGFCAGLGIFMVACIGNGLTVYLRRQAVWKAHDFTWYRNAFPSHAHAHGEVSCRHCGSRKVRVRNMMEHTYMKAHECVQCGKALYFSPEQQ
jgi:hypothetical protein